MALLSRDGLAALPHLNFPLADYHFQLSPALLAAASQRGLLPPAGAAPPAPAASPPLHEVGQLEATAAPPTAAPAAAAWNSGGDSFWWGCSHGVCMAADSARPAWAAGSAPAPCAEPLQSQHVPSGAAGAPEESWAAAAAGEAAAAAGDGWMAPPLPQPVARKASMTPRPAPSWG
jgi:hypothetical protein